MMDIAEITKKLETGVNEVFQSENYAKYLDTMSKFYDYSFNNCVLIFMQMPQASYIAGYNAWRDKFDRQVRKGEKAIKIIAPIPHKKKIEDNGEEKEIQWNTFRAVNVFDVSQTEGKELPSLVHQLEADADVELKNKLEVVSPVNVSYEKIDSGANGYYSASENKIVVKTDMSMSQTIKTLIHEIAHSMLHNKDGEEKEADRHTKEVQAESVSYIVCQNFGIDTSDYSFGYIAGWSRGKDAKELTKSMEIIRRTAKNIIDSLK